MKYNQVLDPFCEICGKYKGVGFCKDPDCKGYRSSEMNNNNKTRSLTVSKLSDDQNQCNLCGNHAIVICNRCNQGFCKHHSKESDSSRLHHKDQHIGTCTKCQRHVCENCWILDATGSIKCLNHLEKNKNNANE